MSHRRRLAVLRMLVLALVLCAACTSPELPPAGPSPTASAQPLLPAPQPSAGPGAEMPPLAQPRRTAAVVTGIADGDTIYVKVAGEPFKVRYIGIDSPEMDSAFGPAAREANRQLVSGQTVHLEKDVSETDRYGRLLRYVYLLDGTFVNAELVRLGWAEAKAYPPDTRHQSQLSRLQQEARQAQRGLWLPTPSRARPTPPGPYPATVLPP